MGAFDLPLDKTIQKYMEVVAANEMDFIGITCDVNDCIKLLQEEGSNTKGQVLEILTTMKQRYLKPYDGKKR